MICYYSGEIDGDDCGNEIHGDGCENEIDGCANEKEIDCEIGLLKLFPGCGLPKLTRNRLWVLDSALPKLILCLGVLDSEIVSGLWVIEIVYGFFINSRLLFLSQRLVVVFSFLNLHSCFILKVFQY
jgi:hypothetical protein